MKKHITLLLMATALLLVLGQCKKHDDFDYVHITLKVADNSKHNVFTSTGAVTYTNGDIIYVANNGKYVGYLSYGDGVFSGDIARAFCSDNDYLYFYFLGGKGPDPASLEVGTTTSLTADISDQGSTLPVISYGHSDRKFNNGPATYTCVLDNQCALAKFIVDTPSTAAICITGMNNRVSVNLNASNEDERFSFDQVDGGLIKMAPKNDDNETWAILLPQAAVPAGEAYTADGHYFGTYSAISGGIAANQFLNIGISMTVNTTPVEIPLTFEAMEAGATVTFDICTSAATNPVYISTDNGENWSAYTSGTAIPLTNVGDKVSFRGNNARYATADEYSYFSCNEDCYIYGNVMSLINSTDYANTKELTQNYALRELFYNNTHIVNHSSKTLVLPATTLTPWCYYGMFGSCKGLKTAPALPATNLAENCYMKMFSNCTSLETAPDLPATTLAVYCYQYMFSSCTSLETAPDLPATTLANSCYQSMFESCTGLKTAPELPATNLAENCYMYMFSFCTSLEEAPALPATTLVTSCYNTMFKGCTSLTKAPTLPATTLVTSCYNSMFYGCTSLTTAPILPAPALVNRCYYYMFYGCTNLNRVTCLATSGINLNSSTSNWLGNVASSGTFTKNAFTLTGSTGISGQYWKTDNANGIPSGWTVEDYAP